MAELPIIVKANKDKFKNLITYSIINNILKKKIRLMHQNSLAIIFNVMIEISDLGEQSFHDKILKKKINLIITNI